MPKSKPTLYALIRLVNRAFDAGQMTFSTSKDLVEQGYDNIKSVRAELREMFGRTPDAKK